ncbi:acyltransferase [Pedobacter changchengzhani]|uniref:Acyltransferase n=1 Tax=Pedobacter changchengzhani TaxID=2529274 RepID=A0A4R5MN40_9SPHI|nr:acyltransferase [Pedobacter changchengzhani]TDG37152.1 acyltransferase [Pedobacter changchengzhani]
MKIEEHNLIEPGFKKNFDFVDTIRCISMMGIVWEHSSAISIELYTDKSSLLVQSITLQIFKFASIAFFLIAGFLINHKFQEYPARQYLKNRFKNTVKPWLFWVVVFMSITILDRLVAYAKGSDGGLLVSDFPLYFYNLTKMILFFSPYWFILNFLICISILLLFKRFLYKIWLGVILGMVSIVYSVNLHYGWFETSHSAALFGFVFYLWLGVYLNKYFDQFRHLINKTPWFVIYTLLLISLSMALLESFYLVNLGIKDAYNTLRFTNIIYSLVAFFALFKMGSLSFLKKLKPRQTTYGIYLIHFIILERVLALIFQPLKLDFSQFSIWVNTGITLGRFLFAYIMSLVLTMLISKTKMKWIVGQ